MLFVALSREDEMSVTLATDEKSWVTARLRKAGYLVGMVWRIYPPRDTGSDLEVLFTGRVNRLVPFEPLTGHLPDDPERDVTVSEGW